MVAGASFARLLRPGTTILLIGQIGSGKTTFVRGLARSLGIRTTLASPTFLLLKTYPVRRPGLRRLHHIDEYRLKRKDNLAAIGLVETLQDKQAITCIENPDRLGRQAIRPWRVRFQVTRSGRTITASRR